MFNIDISTLALFVMATLALFVSPGPNMAFVLSSGLADGARGGLAAALGITVADLVLTALTATGVVAVIAAWPPSFDLLRYGGALYLSWMGFRAITASRQTGMVSVVLPTSSAVIFQRAFFNCLLNPKALLFFMLFLPQFVVAHRGSEGLQIGVLGCVLTVVGLLFHGLLGLFSGRAAAALRQKRRGIPWQIWLQCTVLLALAARTVLFERPVSR
jgi:threonine/homoserine/homoserine lactone efflux protein